MSKKSTTGEFISKSKLIHGDKYDYSKVEYVNNHSKVCIICPEHGEFWQTPANHLKNRGCPICGGHQKSSTEEFIKKANKVHNNKYDYSKVEYKNIETKVCIICPEHGEFWQSPEKHLIGQGCVKCSYIERNVKKTDTVEQFIQKSKKIHGNKYDYSKVNYVNTNTKVCIICPKHGEFLITPNNHLRGKGCPKCNQSKLERDIIINFTGFIKEQRFDWLKYNDYMRLDFFFPDYNIAIECQGEQHFKSIDRFGGENELQKRLFNDKLKYELCKQHNIEIIYYFPKRFMKHNISFYNDKKCFYNINDIIKYMNNKV